MVPRSMTLIGTWLGFQGPVCGCVTDGRTDGRAGGVRYHDNSKLRASIFTKLGL